MSPRWCPFCGSENIDDSCSEENEGGETFFYMFCNGCDAMGPCAATAEKACEKWNVRQSEPFGE